MKTTTRRHDYVLMPHANSSSADIQLTTVYQPPQAMGFKMAQMMLRLLRGQPVERDSS